MLASQYDWIVPDVLPVAVEAVAEHPGAAVEHRRDHVAPEVRCAPRTASASSARFENT